MELASVEATGSRLREAIEALRRGGMAMLLDRGEDGGGHLVAAGEPITAETVATMLREATGMPFLALAEERCLALGLHAIGAGGDMMVTIEARDGTTTGISAADRALTMRVASGPTYTGADVVEPGHVLPIRIAADRIVTRADAPAAALELAAFAGSPGGAALCQVLDAAGAPASVADAEALAARLGLPQAERLEVVERRLRDSRLVARDGDERILETASGPFRCVAYRGLDGDRHFALVHGDPAQPEPIRLETVVQDPPLDAFGGPAPREAVAKIAATGRGVLLYLAPNPTDLDLDPPVARARRAHLIRQILRDLGVAAIVTGE
ncbi:MAG: 3,4-dihydroxy-2-butanone-4-phosphate synthase [Actinobacteria bacterium]|nr:3,4-dihydroxy-2-butanone-4-phosphate synthase [Actinomycetota bacterium]